MKLYLFALLILNLCLSFQIHAKAFTVAEFCEGLDNALILEEAEEQTLAELSQTPIDKQFQKYHIQLGQNKSGTY